MDASDDTGTSHPTYPSPDTQNVRIVAASLDDQQRVTDFLAPFVSQRLLLRRTPEEIATLLPTGFMAMEALEGASDSAQPLIGFCSVEIYSKKLAEIQCLCVLESHRRHGIGRKLVECCLELARARGVMEVLAISSSEKFLQDLGFDYSLPQQKRALFYQIRSRDDD